MKYLVIILFIISTGLIACGGKNENKKTAPDTLSNRKAQPAETSGNAEIPADVNSLLEKYTCLNCHNAEEKLIGPAYKAVALKGYRDEEIVNLIYNPKPENWPGYPPMLPQKEVPRADAMKIAGWINSLR